MTVFLLHVHLPLDISSDGYKTRLMEQKQQQWKQENSIVIENTQIHRLHSFFF